MPEIDWSALQTPDFGANALKANALGRQEGLSLAKQNALRQYTTDPQGGIQALMAVDPATAVTLQKAEAERRQQESAIQAGGLYASGDINGARKAAAGSGNFAMVGQMDEAHQRQIAQASAANGQLASFAASLKTKYPDQLGPAAIERRKAAIAANRDNLISLGIPAEKVDGFVPTSENIDGLMGTVLNVKEQHDQALADANAAEPKFTTFEDGGRRSLLQTNPRADGAAYVPGQGWVGGAPNAAPPQAQSGPQDAPPPGQPAPADASAPRGIRNRNLLNLKPPPEGQWNGQTGVDGAGYAQFDTPEAGWTAADKNLTSYATRHGVNTIQGVIARWAPAGDGSNDPAAYAATVSQALGVKPDQPIDLTNPQVRQKVLTAMAQVEQGQPVAPPTGGPAPQAAPEAETPTSGVTAGGWQPRTVMTGRAEPKIQSVTGDDGAVHYYDISDPQHPTALPISGVASQGTQILTDPKTNTQFVYNPRTKQATTLDGKPYTPQGAQKIASGTARSGAAMVMQKWQAEHPDATAAQTAQQYAKVGEMARAAIAFGSGPQGNLVRSFNVGIQHLDTFGRLADALGNGNVQAINAVKQEIAQQTGKPAPNSFEAAKQMVMDEIVKAVIGGGGGVGDREKAQAAVSRANSPAQLRDVIKTYKELMSGQLSGLKRQYINATGFDDFEAGLDPATIAALEAHTGAPAGGAPAAAGSRPPLSSFKR